MYRMDGVKMEAPPHPMETLGKAESFATSCLPHIEDIVIRHDDSGRGFGIRALRVQSKSWGVRWEVGVDLEKEAVSGPGELEMEIEKGQKMNEAFVAKLWRRLDAQPPFSGLPP